MPVPQPSLAGQLLEVGLDLVDVFDHLPAHGLGCVAQLGRRVEVRAAVEARVGDEVVHHVEEDQELLRRHAGAVGGLLLRSVEPPRAGVAQPRRHEVVL